MSCTMLQSDADIEAALFDAAATLAKKHDFALVQCSTGYRLAGHGRMIHLGLIHEAVKAVRRFAKTTQGPLAGAGCATALDLPENALQAVLSNV